jgi:hypothetical protein
MTPYDDSNEGARVGYPPDVNRDLQPTLVDSTGRIPGHTSPTTSGTDMNKFIAAIMAALFAVVTITPAFAAADEKKATADQKKAVKKKGDDKKAEDKKVEK